MILFLFKLLSWGCPFCILAVCGVLFIVEEKETKELALGFLLATVTTGRQRRLFNGRRSDNHLSLLHQVEELVRAGEILLWGGVVETSREWGITLPTFSYIN